MNGNPLYTETPANKTFGNNKDTGGRAKGRPNAFNPNSNTFSNKGQEVRKVVVESHLVVVDVEKKSMPLRQEKNGLTKDRYKTCSRTSKKNGSREANLT